MGGRVYDPIAARFTTADPIHKAIETRRLFLFCPLCAVAWSELPAPNHLEEILTPETLAPNGATLPTADDVHDGVFHGVVEVSWQDWFPLLDADHAESVGNA